MEESRRGGDPRRAAWMHGREIPVNLDDACAFDGYEARGRAWSRADVLQPWVRHFLTLFV